MSKDTTEERKKAIEWILKYRTAKTMPIKKNTRTVYVIEKYILFISLLSDRPLMPTAIVPDH